MFMLLHDGQTSFYIQGSTDFVVVAHPKYDYHSSSDTVVWSASQAARGPEGVGAAPSARFGSCIASTLGANNSASSLRPRSLTQPTVRFHFVNSNRTAKLFPTPTGPVTGSMRSPQAKTTFSKHSSTI